MESQEGYAIVLSTTNDEESRQAIIEALLNEKLAACIQVMPISSYYQWHGEVNCDEESLMIIKILHRHYIEVERVILAHHNYQVPQVVMLPIETGFHEYLQWIQKSSK
ncbi:divalent-cation tolerance protein CutA [Vibrio rumoiensis]|uniref:Cytochrome C biogenesis protein n=1 Tax=Vibrio rumoiensis 1S-45 TaxID=1188252 RepID=A0A1E5E4D2_9VIBR|nr:divalent-cation tolerance protein CutA [Vibrio rumoiensis]OEF27616.1 cytochrome C biogenesis protein [Vibrio rumoiensis 1S-45]